MLKLNWTLIRYAFGILLLMESFFMAISLCVSLYYHYVLGESDWQSFLVTTGATAITGALLLTTNRHHNTRITTREGYFIVTMAWLLCSFFGMIPYLLTGACSTVTDAFIEIMSGFTTTGCTVIDNLEQQPRGILFWRGLTQWMGGLGIVVFSLALLPMIGTGATQIFGAETNGLNVDKLRPKIDQTARRLWIIYLVLTTANALCYWAGDMSLYDAVVHAFSTMASGGFGTHSENLGYFHSAYIEYVCIAFLFITSINFNLFYFVGIGQWRVFWRNEEFRWFFWLVTSFTIFFMILQFCIRWGGNASEEQLAAMGDGSFETTFRSCLFHTLTIISSAGFQAETFDYCLWGSVFMLPTLLLMAMGGCSSSTAGGLKVVRMVVLAKNVRNEFYQALHPRSYSYVKLNGSMLHADKVYKVMAMLLIYLVLIIVSIFVMQCIGLSFDTSVGAVISAFGNTGPALGTLGPAFTWSSLPDFGKWYLALAMLVGRLELFTVLLIAMPMFWKK